MATHTKRFILLFVVTELILISFIDRPLAKYMHQLDTTQHGLIDFFRAITDLGLSKWYLWPAVIGVIFCAIGLRIFSLSPQRRVHIINIGEFLFYLFANVAASGLVTNILKRIIGRARPVELIQHQFYGFDPINFEARFNSFPSGHATTACVLFFLVASRFPKLRIAALTFTVAVSVSRVMVNAHFVSDILAGACVAFITHYVLQNLWLSVRMSRVNHSFFPIDKPANPKVENHHDC
jgi:undecaprenyl-diphosphatase